jgi:hypothetical protein
MSSSKKLTCGRCLLFICLRPSHRVGIFRQKNNSAEDGIDGTNGYFRRNSGCSAEQKTSEFRSEPFRKEEKTTRNSVPLNKNRSKLSEFPSEHFSGRENNSEFRSVETKIEEYSHNFIPNPSAEEKTTRNSVNVGIPFRTIPRKRNLLNTKRGSPNVKNSVRKDDF